MSAAEKYIAYADKLKANRSTWESHWQEVADLIYPQRGDFTITRHPGEKRQSKIFDSTPVHAAELLASGLHGMMTNPATRWFSMVVAALELQSDREVMAWLSDATRVMYDEMNDPKAGFTTSMHEFYMDFVSFNTGIIFVGERENLDGLRFSARSLAETSIAENGDGHVDVFYRRYEITIGQALDKWKADQFSEVIKKQIEKKLLSEKITIVHVIEPRREREMGSKAATQKPFKSIYIESATKHIISESGFDEQPMMAARFMKASSAEVYGRGPGISTLSDVKMLNSMMQTTIKAAQKVVDPPLLVENDSMIGPVRAIPSGINYFKRGRTQPGPLMTGGRIDLGENMMDGIRLRIREAFFVDQLQLNNGPQMTATEVIQRTEEKLRLMGPILGRLQTELLGPMIDRVFNILVRQKKIPLPPAILKDKRVSPEYESPLSRAQRQLEAAGFERTIQTITPLIETDLTVMDNFDGDFIASYVGSSLFGLNPKMYRDPDARDAIREQRRKDQSDRSALEKDQMVANVKQTTANAEAAGG